tara:strand:- start:5159 stop:7438 length:2280 start_codon:yes stop_codon:yes gene_type:complete
VVYPLINNYKSQRNVRAELGGAVDLGKPVSLYIKEDEIKITGNNLINDNAYKDSAVTGDGGWSKYGDNVITTTETSVRIASDGSGHENGAYIYFRNGTKSFVDNDLVVGRQYVLSCFMLTDSTTAHLEIRGGSNTADGTTGTGQKELRFTAGAADTHYLRTDDLDTLSAKFVELSNIKLFEVTDHTYKLMAVNDTIPSKSINTEAVGSELITNGDAEVTDPTTMTINSVALSVSDATMDDSTEQANGGSKSIKVTADSSSNYPHIKWADGSNMGLTSGRTYIAECYVYLPAGQDLDTIKLKAIPNSGSGDYINNATTTTNTWVKLSGTFTDDDIDSLQVIGYKGGGGTVNNNYYYVDDISLKEVYGYDYYNAPAYKFGIISSVYDQSTGAMKTSGVAGDEVDVTVQGECNVISGSNYSENKNSLLTRIAASGEPTDYAKADSVLPNAVGVVTEQVSSSKIHPIILFQGVEFSEHFVHKNSLQVMAKCDETITRFRPVSLFLDSNGDLLCRHDDIPAETPDADTDHTGVDPGKWGISELGGVSGDIIPVTVAGKTHFNTNSTMQAGWVIKQLKEGGVVLSDSSGSNDYIPNALGTTMGNHTISSHTDIPITIFGGTPIGTITDWKRTIKVTAKANGAITQYCPVSLYLDQYGNYKCISDNIPNTSTNTANGIWCDFRKWGIAQETVADGENVEIIVQGRTNVVNSLSGADREEFVLKISSAGGVTSGAHGSTAGFALSSLGIVEKEARTSDGKPGVIIIF